MLAANALLTELSIAETEMSDRNVLIQRTTDISLPKISEQFGGRDHTTIIHAYEKIVRMSSKCVGGQEHIPNESR